MAGFTLSVLALGASVFGAAVPSVAVPSASAAQQVVASQLVALEQLREFVERQSERFAGLSTRGSDQVTIHVVSDRSAAAAADLPELQRLASAAGIKVAVEHEKYSLLELNRIQDSIPTKGPFAAEDAGLSRWGVNPDTNTVDVGVLEVTPELLAQAEEAYGDKVVVTRQPRPRYGTAQPDTQQALASGRRTDTPPYYGGDMIDVVGHMICSSGFTLTNLYGTRYAITAGHCGALNARVETKDRSYFGTMYFHRLGNGNLDNALVGGVSYGGRIWVGGPATTSHLPVHSARDSCNGCLVNFDGSFTGEAVGRLLGEPFCATFEGGDYSCGLQRATSVTGAQLCQNGDSGGPIFAHDGQGGVIAVGIFTGYYATWDCVYTRLPPILNSWQSTITTG